jgi:hypothetical protein
MKLGLVVGLAVLAGLLFALSAYLQQLAAREVTQDEPPRLSLRELAALMRRLVRRRIWFAGWLTNLAGFFSQAAALNLGSVVVVQPLLSTDLLFALPLSAREQRRLPTVREWSYAGSICVGLAGVIGGLGSAPLQGSADRGRVLVVVGCAVVGVGLLGTVSAASSVRAGAVFAAVAAGICFAMTAVFMKLTAADLIDRGVPATAVDWPGYALAVSTLTGLVLGQHAYASGPLPWAIAARAVTNPLVSFVVGAYAFRVDLLHSTTSLYFVALGGVLIVAGIVGLSHSATAEIFYESDADTSPDG